MLETMKYVRKTIHVDAVQIEPLNIEEAAKWAKGDVLTDKNGQYVKVGVRRPLNDRQTKAYLGDWILYAGTGFKVYTAKAFAQSFEQSSEVIVLRNVDEILDVVGVVEDELVVPRKVAKLAVPRPPMQPVFDSPQA